LAHPKILEWRPLWNIQRCTGGVLVCKAGVSGQSTPVLDGTPTPMFLHNDIRLAV